MIRRFVCCLLFALFGAPTAGAQGGPLQGFDGYVATAVRDWEVPGLAVAVVRNDSVVFMRGFGVRTLGKPDPVDEHTLFAIGSTTKAFTTTALAMLVDEGKVRWDDPVTKYLPGFQLADPSVTREFTVRDLVTHRSGLPTADLLWYASPNTAGEIIRRLRFLKPASSLRSRYAYNNNMYAVAGAVIAAASGMPWEEFVRRRILLPLGMTSTLTGVGGLATRPNVATPHRPIDDTIRAIPYRNLDNIAPAGAMNAGVADLAKWVRFQLDSARVGGRRLVDSTSYREMLAPQFVIPPESFYPAAQLARPNFIAYGLGWFLQDYRGRKLVMHTGSIDGMSALIGMLPEERLGVIVLANLDHAEVRHALMYHVFDLHLGGTSRDWSAELRKLYGEASDRQRTAVRKAESARVASTRPSLPLGAYAGTYTDSLYGDVDVRVEKGALVARFGSGYVGDLEHWHHDVFRARWRDRVLGRSFLTFKLDPARQGVTAVSIEGIGEFTRRAGRSPQKAP